MSAKRLVVSLAMILGITGSSVAVASQATPEPVGMPPLPEGCSVIASDLVNPRYVAVGDDGTIYVSEAGVGGDEIVAPPVDPSATPAPEAEEGMPPGTRGYSGQVSMIAPDGTQSVMVTGLPSYSMGVETIGPAGIAVADGQVLLAVGGAGPATAFTEALPNENSVVSIDPASGEVTLLADIGAYERAENPDPFNIDSNLYGIDSADDGTIYVNDAGGNATYMIPAGGGEPQVVVVHPGLELPEGMEAPPGGNPGRGGEMALDPVPTDILTAADGSVLVSYLSGGPFPPGAAKVVSVAADGTIADVSTGLTMSVGLAAGPDGHLYATQLSTNFLGEMPEPGNVVRLHGDGPAEVVVDGLVLPNGIAFDADGNLLVVVNSVSMGEPNGQLLRCEGVAAAADSSPEVTIELSDMQYTPSSFTVPANQDVTIKLVNTGFATHDVSIDALGIKSKMLAAGEEVELTVNLPAGTYGFGCDVPGHRIAGMTGVIEAVE